MNESSTSSQDRILYQIKRLGPQSVKSLAATLEVTTMGVRQHLNQLEEDGLVTSLPEEPQPRGRPLKPWKLTGKGHLRFPDGHSQVTSDLIISVREIFGDAGVDKIIKKRTSDTYRQYQASLDLLPGLAEKIQDLARLRTNEGYMANTHKDGKEFVLTEDHCPICVAAKTCQGFCESELEVFQKLFKGQATVKREDHLITGARRCSYRITPLSQDVI